MLFPTLWPSSNYWLCFHLVSHSTINYVFRQSGAWQIRSPARDIVSYNQSHRQILGKTRIGEKQASVGWSSCHAFGMQIWGGFCAYSFGYGATLRQGIHKEPSARNGNILFSYLYYVPFTFVKLTYLRFFEILQEKMMLNTLQYNMSVPTVYVFLRRFLKAAQADKTVSIYFFQSFPSIY